MPIASAAEEEIAMIRILVAYGSKRGGTAEIAEWIAAVFNAAGAAAVVHPAREVRDVQPYDAVVVAGSLYAYRWHRDARAFCRRFAHALRERPVWLVSSGPLDGSAGEKEIPMVPTARTAYLRIGARGHVTFGGRLAPDAAGFPAASMAKRMAGDFRDRTQVEAWAKQVADALHTESA
jgi:menaquinone-dependent protoporphyrinogen oxidase